MHMTHVTTGDSNLSLNLYLILGDFMMNKIHLEMSKGCHSLESTRLQARGVSVCVCLSLSAVNIWSLKGAEKLQNNARYEG